LCDRCESVVSARRIPVSGRERCEMTTSR
jgi:hypothetical protein